MSNSSIWPIGKTLSGATTSATGLEEERLLNLEPEDVIWRICREVVPHSFAISSSKKCCWSSKIFHRCKQNCCSHLLLNCQFSQLRENTPTAPLQRGNPHLTSVLDMTLNCIWWWSSIPGALGNVEYLFIAITPRYTLIRIINLGSNSIV